MGNSSLWLLGVPFVCQLTSMLVCACLQAGVRIHQGAAASLTDCTITGSIDYVGAVSSRSSGIIVEGGDSSLTATGVTIKGWGGSGMHVWSAPEVSACLLRCRFIENMKHGLDIGG